MDVVYAKTDVRDHVIGDGLRYFPKPYDPWEGTNWYLSSVSPNPSRSLTSLHVPSPWPGQGLVRLFDVQGRLVRVWRDIPLSRGVETVSWDARTDAGERAPGGIYFWEVTVTGSGGTIQTHAKSVLLSR